MAINRLSPRAVALLLLLNAKFYAAEREKEVAPYRFTALLLRRIAGRSRLRTAFIEQLSDELIGEGWHLLQNDEVEFAIFPVARTKPWAKLSSKRIAPLMLRAHHSTEENQVDIEAEIEDSYEQEFGFNPDEDFDIE